MCKIIRNLFGKFNVFEVRDDLGIVVFFENENRVKGDGLLVEDKNIFGENFCEGIILFNMDIVEDVESKDMDIEKDKKLEVC